MEVMEPPYIEPYQIPASMMMADVVSRKYVTGSSSAIVAAEPSPGRMPITTPSATPAKHNSRFIGCRETENPSARFERSSMPARGPVEGSETVQRGLFLSRHAAADLLYSVYRGEGECQFDVDTPRRGAALRGDVSAQREKRTV